MPSIQAAAFAIVDAPASTVYSVLADYHAGHPAILPEQYFPRLEVEQGGFGEGTQIRFEMRALGQTRTVRARIEEPQPGRVLLERVLDERATVTRFVVDPLGPSRCQVAILTQWSSPGLSGWLERLIAPRLLRRIYREELNKLAEYTAYEPEDSTRLATQLAS